MVHLSSGDPLRSVQLLIFFLLLKMNSAHLTAVSSKDWLWAWSDHRAPGLRFNECLLDEYQVSDPEQGASAHVAAPGPNSLTDYFLKSPCTNHAFYFLYPDLLTSWGLENPGGTAPPRVSQCLEIINLPSHKPFHMHTNQAESTLLTASLLALTPRATVHLPLSPQGQASAYWEQPLCGRASEILQPS